MADDDPYAKYLKPSGGSTPAAPTGPAAPDADPYSKYLPNQPVTTASDSGENTALANYGYDPHQHSVSENLAHLWSNPVQHIQAATGGLPDFVRVAGNALGLGDWLHSTVTGLTHPFDIEAQKADWEAQQAQTKDASQHIGPVATVAANLVGSAPLAAAGSGATTADAIAPYVTKVLGQKVGTWGAGVVGSSAENAALSALSAGAQGEDPIAAAKMGLLTGGAAGLPGGVTKRLPVRGPLAATSDLEAKASGLQTDLEGVHFDPADVEKSFHGVEYNLSKGDKAGMSPSLKGTINDISKAITEGGSVTADDMAKFQRSLFTSTRSDSDYRLATKFSNGLNDTLSNARPWAGAAPGEAKGMVDAANLASNKANISSDIDTWLKKPGTAPAQVGKALENKPRFYKNIPGISDALGGVSRMTGQVPLNPWLVHHLVGGAVGEGVNALTGEHLPWWAGIGGGFLGSAALKGGLNMRASANVANALKNAQYLAQTGQRVSTPRPTWDLLQMLTRSAGIAGPNAATQ
jgi:hypothetical protein